MPYLSFTTTEGKPVELAGNSAGDFEKAFVKHGAIAAVPEAKAYVAAFFERRKVAIDRQKALQANNETEAERLEDMVDELQEKEDKTKAAYAHAVVHGSTLKDSSLDGVAANGGSGGPSKSGNLYGDAFEQQSRSAPPQAEDDFM